MRQNNGTYKEHTQTNTHTHTTTKKRVRKERHPQRNASAKKYSNCLFVCFICWFVCIICKHFLVKQHRKLRFTNLRGGPTHFRMWTLITMLPSPVLWSPRRLVTLCVIVCWSCLIVFLLCLIVFGSCLYFIIGGGFIWTYRANR